MNLHQIIPSFIATRNHPSGRCSAFISGPPGFTSGSRIQVVRFVAFVLALLMLFPVLGLSQAKAPAELTLRDLAVDALETPRFSVSSDAKQGKQILQRPQWLELRSEFRTDKEWIDEVEFKYYLLMDQADPRALPSGAARANILTGKVTYQDVPKHTLHTSTMFLSPMKVMRYGKPVAYRVEVTIGGKPVAMEEKVPASLKNFHTRPGKELLLKRNDTPFIFIDRNSFNDIKPNAVR